MYFNHLLVITFVIRLAESASDFMSSGTGDGASIGFWCSPFSIKRGGHSDSLGDVIDDDMDVPTRDGEDEGSLKQEEKELEASSNLNNVDATTNVTFIFPPKPVGIKNDLDGIPTRFLEMQKNNRDLAAESYKNTLQWREENEIDNILNKPQPRFDIFKAIAPHYFPGFDVKGNIILIQRPGLINMELKKANNVSDDVLVNHMVFVLEYCWALLAPPKLQGDSTYKDCVMTSVIDMTGINLGVIRHRDRLDFASQFVKIMSAHYPSRSYKTLIINAPGWFGALFKLFKPMLRESTRKKIAIFSSGKPQDKALRKILGDSTPTELLSDTISVLGDEHSAGQPGPHSTLELELRSFCLERIHAHGLEMETVIVATT